MRSKSYFVLILAGAMSCAAQTPRGNLDGNWRLNVSRSFLGGDHPFDDYQLTKRIEHRGDTISITDTSVHNSVVNIPLPDSATTLSVATDGHEHELELPGGFPGSPPAKVRVTADWQGCALELRQVTSGLAIYAVHRLFLSDDGSQLIDQVEQHSIFGDSEQRLVFDKGQ
jgi:hypothetical protein